ncbi:SNARE domain-containing protein [Cryptosporidium serpentis]
MVFPNGMSNQTIIEEETKAKEHELCELQDQCQKSVKNTLKIAASANEISRNSATKLNEQTEQLHRIKNDTETIKDNLDKTDDVIFSLQHPILAWFKELFSHKDSESQKCSQNKKSAQTKYNHEYFSINGNQIGNDIDGKDKVLRTKCKGTDHNFESSINNDLDDIGDLLKEMHGRALNMNLELKKQTEVIEDINSNVDTNYTKMKGQRKKLGEIIKK